MLQAKWFRRLVVRRHMTPLDRVMPFAMEHWTLVFLACVLATVICFAGRRSGWIIAIWLPSFFLAAAYTVFFFSVFFAPRGSHTPDDGYLGMALMFQALFSLPVFLTAVLLLFVRPPSAAWRSPFLFVGLLFAAVAPFVLRFAFHVTRQPVSFSVTDSNGTPLRGVGSRLLGTRSPVASTDDSGQLTRRMEHGYDLQGSFVADGYLPHSIEVNVAGRQLHVGHAVPKPGTRHEQVYTDEFYPLSSSVQIRIVMNPTPTQ